MIVRKNNAYCLGRGIYENKVDKDHMNMILISKEKEQLLNDEDFKAYTDLVKAVIFLKRVVEYKRVPPQTLAAVPDTFLKEILKFDDLPLKVINELIALANNAAINFSY